MAQRSTLPQAAAAGDLNGVIAILEKAAAETDALDQKRAEAGLRPHPLPPGWTAPRLRQRKYRYASRRRHRAPAAASANRPRLRARGTRGRARADPHALLIARRRGGRNCRAAALPASTSRRRDPATRPAGCGRGRHWHVARLLLGAAVWPAASGSARRATSRASRPRRTHPPARVPRPTRRRRRRSRRRAARPRSRRAKRARRGAAPLAGERADPARQGRRRDAASPPSGHEAACARSARARGPASRGDGAASRSRSGARRRRLLAAAPAPGGLHRGAVGARRSRGTTEDALASLAPLGIAEHRDAAWAAEVRGGLVRPW